MADGKPGRPKKYTDDNLDHLAKSLKEWTKSHSSKNKFGMLKKWCFDNDFHPKHFKRYIEKHEEFREAYELAKEWQEYIICHGALNQTLNARFAQFFLGCNHGWKTKDASSEALNTLHNDFGKFLDYMDSHKKEVDDDQDDDCDE